jgi:hypothetical protein
MIIGLGSGEVEEGFGNSRNQSRDRAIDPDSPPPFFRL